jgi:hypothetical protein
VVRKTDEGGRQLLITRGDALAHEDPAAAAGELLGRVRAVIRGRKRIELGEDQPAGQRLVQRALRNFEGLAVWVLRWNLLSVWMRQVRGGGQPEYAASQVECW